MRRIFCAFVLAWGLAGCQDATTVLVHFSSAGGSSIAMLSAHIDVAGLGTKDVSFPPVGGSVVLPQTVLVEIGSDAATEVTVTAQATGAIGQSVDGGCAVMSRPHGEVSCDVVLGAGSGDAGVPDGLDLAMPDLVAPNCSMLSSPGPAWQVVTSTPALLPRSKPALTADSQGRVYAIGGDTFGDGGMQTGSVQVYDPDQPDAGWQDVAPLNSPREKLVAGTDGTGHLFAIGGSTFPNNASSSVEELTPGPGASWQKVASLAAPRTEAAATTGHDGKVYVVGGGTPGTITATLAATVELVSAAGSVLSPILITSAPRAQLAADTGPDGSVYVFGGRLQNATNTIIASAERYDPATGAVTALPPIYKPLAEMATAVGSDGHIYLIGGVGGDNQDQTVEVFVPKELSSDGFGHWDCAARLTFGRRSSRGALGADGRIYVIAGYDSGVDQVLPVEAYGPTVRVSTTAGQLSVAGQNFVPNAAITVELWTADNQSKLSVLAPVSGTASLMTDASGTLAATVFPLPAAGGYRLHVYDLVSRYPAWARLTVN